MNRDSDVDYENLDYAKNLDYADLDYYKKSRLWESRLSQKI